MKKAFAYLSSFVVVLSPLFVLAAEKCDSSKQLCNPIKYDTFSAFVVAITESAVKVLLPFVVIAFIYTGFLFVKAQGKPAEIETAQKSLMWSAIGTAILLGAWGFAQIIERTIKTITTTVN